MPNSPMAEQRVNHLALDSPVEAADMMATPPSSPLKRPPMAHEEETIGCPPKRRVRAKPDGRCQLRAVLHASGLTLPVSSILTDDSREARAYIRQTRAAAVRKLQQAMEEDETLQMIVTCSFPDERYDSFDEWVETNMEFDDTEMPNSSLWHGGGHWLLYGLGLLLDLTIEVTSLYPQPWDVGTGFIQGGTHDVVAAGERRVHLAMLHDDDGTPDHFDVLEALAATAPSTADPGADADADAPIVVLPALAMAPAPALVERHGDRPADAAVAPACLAAMEAEPSAVEASRVAQTASAGHGLGAERSPTAESSLSSWRGAARDWGFGFVLGESA